MIGIGVVGYGYWGPNLARNFAETAGGHLVAISDLSARRLDAAKTRHPWVTTSTDYQDVIRHPDVEAVVIATPARTHHAIGLAALRAGKHVLIEKPLASSVREAEELVAVAGELGRVLMVDHTFVYTGAVRRLRELVDSGSLGKLLYYDAVRVNLGLFQHDVNVLWDLAVHDLAIMDYVLQTPPRRVSATGIAHAGRQETISYITLFFDDSLIAHVHTNWLAPVKVRRTLLGGTQKLVVYDDVEPSEKIKVYDKGITVTDAPEDVYQILIQYRTGDVWAPQLDTTEALRREAEHFLASINQRVAPLTDGKAGLRIVRTLEAASESIRQGGAPVEIPATA